MDTRAVLYIDWIWGKWCNYHVIANVCRSVDITHISSSNEQWKLVNVLVIWNSHECAKLSATELPKSGHKSENAPKKCRAIQQIRFKLPNPKLSHKSSRIQNNVTRWNLTLILKSIGDKVLTWSFGRCVGRVGEITATQRRRNSGHFRGRFDLAFDSSRLEWSRYTTF